MNNQLKTYAIIGAITFLIGIFIGYSIWGVPKKKEKVNVSELLTQALEEVRAIERENSNLRARIERIRKGEAVMESLKKENTELQTQIRKLKEENASLQTKINALIKDSELLATLKKENEELKARISELKTKALESKGEEATTSEDIKVLKEKIKSLEEENQRLKSVIKQIRIISGSEPEK